MTDNENVPKKLTSREIFTLFKPYVPVILTMALVSVASSTITGAASVALTPLLEIVLAGGLPETSASLSFDLEQLGASLVGLTARLTGYNEAWPLLVVSSLVYLFLALMGQAVGFWVKYWANTVRLKIIRDIHYDTFLHILKLPLSFFQKYQPGWIVAHVVWDIGKVVSITTDTIVNGLSSLILAMFYSVLLIATDWRLTGIAVIAGIIHLGVSRLLKAQSQKQMRESLELSAVKQGYEHERFSIIREIKSHVAEAQEQERYLDIYNEHLVANFRYFFFKHVESPIRWMVNRAVMVVVMLSGGYWLLDGQLSAPAFLAFMFFAQNLIGPVGTLGGLILQFQIASAALDSVAFILDQKTEESGTRDLPEGGLQQVLKLDGVTFEYDNDEGPVLRDINLTINKGETVALVGQSGAGKSTLVDLILRYFEPTEGCITLDGEPIREFKLDQYRQMFGVVSQSSVLLNDTVEFNILYAHPELTLEDAKQAAKVANADGFIEELTNDYQTLVGDRGQRFSGGQIQRLAIARAIAHSPAILILDEATSALDSEAEWQVQKAIAQVVKNSTAIVIAHRLSTIRMADKIVVLKEGRVVEVGTHEELFALGGEYRYLHDLQFQPEEEYSTPQAS